MEVLEEKIKAFLDVIYGNGYGNGSGDGFGDGSGDGSGSGYGSGDGNGDGSGYGSGDGDGFGYGDGDGNGYGSGNGDGDGNGYGSGNGHGYGDGNGYGYGFGRGISEIDGMKVWSIDGTPTVITSLHGNIAKGYTLRENVNLVPCYVARVGDYFGHGETAHEALQAAQEKYDENRPLSERIADTVEKYPTLDTVVPHKELYALHHTLTGSCKFGRDEFAHNHNLDPEDGAMTVRQFIDLTKDAYGGEAIKELYNAYVGATL